MAKKVIKFLASLKLAVVIIAALASVIAIGTIVEARYDSAAAKKLVYDTGWMYLVMGALSTSLVAVMIDRWPWQKRHAPFVLAHIGILILLLGSVITLKWGIDGNLRVPIGQKNQFVTTSETDLEVWASFNGDQFTSLYRQKVDFFLDRPEKKPIIIATDKGDIKIIGYKPYTLPSRKIVASENPRAGAGIRFQIFNQRVNETEWLLQRRNGDTETFNLGPAQIVLGGSKDSLGSANQVILKPLNGKTLQYKMSSKDAKHKTMIGKIEEGQSIRTEWMGLEFKLLRYIPQAEEAWDFQDLDRPTPITTAAIEVEFQGRRHWLQQNDVLKLFTDQVAYLLVYGQQRIPLGFDVNLKEFEIGRYQGTQRAASYASRVEVEGQESTISMNEPLKKGKYTIYQASFQEGPDGKPVASVFSVNYDPGRWLKYLGSLLICCGTVLLFYNKRKAARAQAPKAGAL